MIEHWFHRPGGWRVKLDSVMPMRSSLSTKRTNDGPSSWLALWISDGWAVISFTGESSVRSGRAYHHRCRRINERTVTPPSSRRATKHNTPTRSSIMAGQRWRPMPISVSITSSPTVPRWCWTHPSLIDGSSLPLRRETSTKPPERLTSFFGVVTMSVVVGFFIAFQKNDGWKAKKKKKKKKERK